MVSGPICVREYTLTWSILVDEDMVGAVGGGEEATFNKLGSKSVQPRGQGLRVLQAFPRRLASVFLQPSG
jgi:hypothetical protein